jgi:hypothetical protein
LKLLDAVCEVIALAHFIFSRFYSPKIYIAPKRISNAFNGQTQKTTPGVVFMHN